jgi:hypothetical protein
MDFDKIPECRSDCVKIILKGVPQIIIELAFLLQCRYLVDGNIVKQKIEYEILAEECDHFLFHSIDADPSRNFPANSMDDF